MSSERAIVKEMLTYLNGLPNSMALKRSGGGMGVAGEPDIDACIGGRSLQLEVKSPGENATPLQQKRLQEWRQAGAVADMVHSVDEVQVLLHEKDPLDRTDAR